MVCAVDPLTSPACVTWAGHLICPRLRLPRAPPAPAAPETVAATFTAIAESGGLASAMSARVSCPPPRRPWTGSKGASSGFQFSFLSVGFSVPSSHYLLLTPDLLQWHSSHWWGLSPHSQDLLFPQAWALVTLL